jgi:hypothetical protein
MRIQLRFGIGLHIRELELIKGICAYFGLLAPLKKIEENNKTIEQSRSDSTDSGPNFVGTRYKYIDIRENSVSFQISKFSDITNIIIPFFDKYPILGQKALDFEDFKNVSLLMKNNEHLTKEGFLKILTIKEGMNQNRF